MRALIFVIFTIISSVPVRAEDADPSVPLENGEYIFTHRFAEHPSIKSIKLTVQVKDGRIVLFNNDRFDVFPKGLIDEGTLMWHMKSGQWIIGTTLDDKDAPDVGGCSDGPSVVDLQNLIYWTC